ncbi:transcription-repair coupling factor [Nonlabens ulvanivorans]|nr:transcription-repair coupling factor [Nonlabens ulvanivorans]
MQKIDVNGTQQEAIKLVYGERDILYVSIHSLHKITRYSSKDGKAPKVYKLGSPAWKKLKAKTKTKVKQIAFDLIQLYAKRRARKGFQFEPDGYLQNELEASFIYEDTPDQSSATADVKADMESDRPMDRLVCGDVGFGKTEVAIRAAFKAAVSGKQVAVLVPTTILAFQHAKTFKERLGDLPVTVDYLNRFRTTKERKGVLEGLANGQVDIVIGTHQLVSKSIQFNDLGLLIIDEEQKFGVGVKDKLKTLKENIDTLTLTATPIPRTLQFSLMAARDLSVIKTAPPNRHPIESRVIRFSEETIRDAVSYEISRGGQVFFVHNRIENIKEVAGMIQRSVPDARVGIGHGQMDGKKLEELMLSFMNGDFDVLVATTIIESGLDVPNANTIFINNANNFGLSACIKCVVV